MLYFKKWFNFIIEGVNEDQALAIVQDQNILNQLKTISPEPKYLPSIAYFYTQTKDLHNLQKYFQKLKTLVDRKIINYQPLSKNGVKLNNEVIDNWLKFTEMIDGIANTKIKTTGKNDGKPVDAKPIFSNGKIDVYEANSPQACIKYGQGYGFCISKPGNTMWQSYRDTQDSSFYFVFDRTLDKSNPLHIVVVDITKDGPALTDASNNTGTIAEYGTNANAYLSHLKTMGVPTEIFKNIAKSPEEEKEGKELGKFKKDLNWFRKLSHDYKTKYIGRGHVLTNEQFDFLWDNKAEDLLQQYINTGQKLNDYQMDKVFTNKNLKNSYLRRRLISNEQINDLSKKEFEQLPLDLQQKIKSDIMNMHPDIAIFIAAQNGHIDIVKLLMDKTNNFDWATKLAAKNGYIDIVKLLMDKSNNFDDILTHAARNGHIDIVKLLMDKAHTVDLALMDAAQNGYIDIVKLLMNKAKTNFNWAIYSAQANGHEDIVKLLSK